MEAYLKKFLQQFQHIKIQLEEIIKATNNFDDQNNYIGRGGFGKVYKGELSHSKGRSIVAIKRLDPKNGQGVPEFLKEITMLSRYRHENLISLVGFCYERNEMILLYEHASHGSLDRHLTTPCLTWSQRLKICLDVAKGLGYLHDPRGTHQRLIHCDVKSANILLDDKWNGKVSDFGLSIMGPANEQQSVIITFAAGTPVYCDPQYAMTHTLTKESDVYSFGVVLFEVLCGRLCCTYNNRLVQQNLVPTWIESCKKKKLNEIIFKNPMIQPLDQCSLETFSDIAYRCLKDSREDRPKMAEVVRELETALEIQVFSEENPHFDYEEMTRTTEPPLTYRSKVDLWKLLSQGVLINGGKTWFSLNKKGEHCEMISLAECLDSVPKVLEVDKWTSRCSSRFAVGCYRYDHHLNVKTHVKTQFLSPGITYTVNLVFKQARIANEVTCHIQLKYKLQGETKNSISYLADEREDGWWICELYQFTADHKVVDLEILFGGFHSNQRYITVEGIEFRPLEKVEHKDENQPISHSDAKWEEKLPTDYEDIMKWSKYSMQWTTEKKAFSIMCNGFLINDGEEWFSLDKNGKKCHMVSAKAVFDPFWHKYMLPSPESRLFYIFQNEEFSPHENYKFGEAFQCALHIPRIMCNIPSHLVSTQTTYACYLVYKLPKEHYEFQAPILVEKQGDSNSNHHWYIYLVTPQTPVIRPKFGQNTHNPMNRPKIQGLPQQRNDGWMEVPVCEFQTPTNTKMIHMILQFSICSAMNHSRVLIQGVEFRPI